MCPPFRSQENGKPAVFLSVSSVKPSANMQVRMSSRRAGHPSDSARRIRHLCSVIFIVCHPSFNLRGAIQPHRYRMVAMVEKHGNHLFGVIGELLDRFPLGMRTRETRNITDKEPGIRATLHDCGIRVNGGHFLILRRRGPPHQESCRGSRRSLARLGGPVESAAAVPGLPSGHRWEDDSA